MADTMYAWTNFNISNPDDPLNPRAAKKIKPGDVVTVDDFTDKEEFDSLVSIGAIRRYEYPEMGSFQGSPVELAKAQLAAKAEGGFFDTQYGSIGTEEPVVVDEKTGQPVEPGTNASGTTGATAPRPATASNG